MELATSAGDTVESLLAKLQARNRVEVGAFRTVFEAHARSQRQARALQERVNALQRLLEQETRALGGGGL